MAKQVIVLSSHGNVVLDTRLRGVWLPMVRREAPKLRQMLRTIAASGTAVYVGEVTPLCGEELPGGEPGGRRARNDMVHAKCSC